MPRISIRRHADRELVEMRFLLRHKTTGYYAVIDEVESGFRHTPNESEATRFEDQVTAETARRAFDSFSGAWMTVEVEK